MKYAFLLLLLAEIMILSALTLKRKELDFYLENELWEMDGLFHFANYDSLSTHKLIFFPVPSDSLCLPPKIKAIAIQDSNGAEVTMLNQAKNGFSFLLSLHLSFCSLHLDYLKPLKVIMPNILSPLQIPGADPYLTLNILCIGHKCANKFSSFPRAETKREGIISGNFTILLPKKEFEVIFQTIPPEDQN